MNDRGVEPSQIMLTQSFWMVNIKWKKVRGLMEVDINSWAKALTKNRRLSEWCGAEIQKAETTLQDMILHWPTCIRSRSLKRAVYKLDRAATSQ